MKRRIANITLVVKDYDQAIAYYTQKLGFELLENTELDKSKRWVVVGPGNTAGTNLLLAKADGKEQQKYIGNQTGGRVFLFLYTDDFGRDYNKMKDQGVDFTESPRMEAYGTVVVFKDLYGNLWDLIQPKR